MRRGVHSCVQCKRTLQDTVVKAQIVHLGRRRKTRCTFRSDDDSSCVGCVSRQVPCISQEDLSRTNRWRTPTSQRTQLNVRERLARLEKQMEELVQDRTSDETNSAAHSTGTRDMGAPAARTRVRVGAQLSDRSSFTSTSNNLQDHAPSDHSPSRETIYDRAKTHFSSLEGEHKAAEIRLELLSVVPTTEELAKALTAVEPWWKNWLFYPTDLQLDEQTTFYEFVMWNLRHPDPLRISIALLCIASSFQQLRPSQPESDLLLPMPTVVLMSHYLEKVERLIISDTSLVSSHGGMAVILLAAKLSVDLGQLQRAWMNYHRALDLMKLMHWNRQRKLTSEESDDAVQRRMSVWSMFNRGDRLLSLLLGLPSGTSDNPFLLADGAIKSHGAFGTSVFRDRLARIAGQVIDRNQADSDVPYKVTLDIENCLTDLATQVPPDWWDVSQPGNPAFPPEEHHERLMSHFMHHQIRLFLHLPFALESDPHRRPTHNVLSCFQAAVDLSRTYHTMRSEKGAAFWLSKFIDHLGFIAAVVMILSLKRDLLPACDEVQVSADWKLVKTTTEILRQVACENAGTSASQAMSTIQHLLEESNNLEIGKPKQFVIPYIGVVHIPCKGSYLEKPNRTTNSLKSTSVSEPNVIQQDQLHGEALSTQAQIEETQTQELADLSTHVVNAGNFNQFSMASPFQIDFEWDNTTFDWSLTQDWDLEL